MILACSVILKMRSVTGKICGERRNTFFFKSCRLWSNVEEYYKAGHATYGNLAHAHCMLDTYSYKHTVIICNNHFFSTASMITHKRLSIKLYVHCLSCFYLMQRTSRLNVISGFRRKVDEICAPLGYYAAYSGNSLPTYHDNIPVPSSRVKKSMFEVSSSHVIVICCIK
jgi:hypothetical protein